MIVWDAGGGGGGSSSDDIAVIINSTDGATSDTGVTTGNYSAGTAEVVNAFKNITNVGPIFVEYDPEWNAIMSQEF